MFITDALAAAPAASTAGGAGFIQLLPLVAMVAVFYFLLWRPQQKRAKAHRDMIAAIQRGDQVVTTGGLIGKVRAVDPDELRLELNANVEVRIVRSAIAEVRVKGAPAPANDLKPAKTSE